MAEYREPLTESYTYILLCLWNGPNHGYGIMQQTLELSGGRVKIGSGTMYGAVSNMLKKGWIRERSASDGYERKREYELTQEGRQTLTAEAGRLSHLTTTIDRLTGGVL